MNRPIVLLFAVAALASGCRKPLPSPDYIEASNRYTNIIAVQGDDAYTSGALDGVIAQLGRVPEKRRPVRIVTLIPRALSFLIAWTSSSFASPA